MVLAFVLATSASIGQAATVQEVSRAVLSNGGYQDSLPGVGSDASNSLDAKNVFPVGDLVRNAALSSATVTLFQFVLYAALVILVCLGLVILFRARTRRNTSMEEGAISGPHNGILLAREFDHQHVADGLAREGRFSEAVHVLLLWAIELLRLRYSVQDSSTARELLRHSTLSPRARRGFETLVKTTEVAHFGGRAVSADEYATCLAGFTEFQSAPP